MVRTLHATVPEPRFWSISVSGEVITLKTGPLHTPGTTRTIECKSPDAALKAAQQMVEQRLRDGFKDAGAEDGERAKATLTETLETERALLEDDLDRWLVFADSLLETTERLRGELIALQVRAARREKGAITRAKEFITEHFDALVGPRLAAQHKQVSVDWRFGYARGLKVWSGPHNPPLKDPLPAMLQSAASRFLQRVEFGSPGGEGRYDTAVRALVQLDWPRHLDSLFLGAFDVEAARAAESAWPRLESLSALTPRAAQLRSLEVRAIFNTLGKNLRFPELKRLVLRPSAIDDRFVADLMTAETPRLETFGLQGPLRVDDWRLMGRRLREWFQLVPLKHLELDDQPRALELLKEVGELLHRVESVSLVGAVPAGQVSTLRALAPVLRQARVRVAPSVAEKVSAVLPRVEAEEGRVKPKPKARPRRTTRYEGITE